MRWIAGLWLAVAGWAAPQPSFVTVVVPLAFDEGCWSTVALHNLRDQTAVVDVEAHDATGALLPLAEVPTMPLKLAAGAKWTLRLQPESLKSTGAWVKITEAGREQPTVAVTALRECTRANVLTSVPGGVAYPARDPWLEASTDEVAGKFLLVLNAAATPASFETCYSNGSVVREPDEGSGKPVESQVCSVARSTFLAAYGTAVVPIQREGSTELRVQAHGESVVLLVLKPDAGAAKRFTVDSKITFGEAVGK
jgi:hypothetical protein